MSKRPDGVANKAKILIVEDDTAIVFGLQKNLTFEGYEVVIATDGEKGLTLALSERPDLIILDIEMPGLTGMEVASSLAPPRPRIFDFFTSARTSSGLISKSAFTSAEYPPMAR